MNNVNRKALQKAVEQLREAAEIIEGVRDDEQEKIDNTPENLEGTERHERMLEVVDLLDEVVDGDLEDMITKIEEAAE